MSQEECWDRFCHSGSIQDYLAWKDTEKKDTADFREADEETESDSSR